MGTLHLLVSGGIGGIESLCKDYTCHSKVDHTVVFLWKGGCIADEMKALGADVVELGYEKKAVFKTLKTLVYICKNRNIDTVIVHHAATLAHVYIMLLKVLLPGMKTIAYLHSNPADPYTKGTKRGAWMRKIVFKCSLISADYIIAISNAVAKGIVKEFRVTPKKIRMIYNGVKVSAFTPLKKKQSDDIFKIIYVGRLTWAKGVHNTLAAVARLPKDINWSFTIAGEGRFLKALEKKALSLGIQDKVLFLGKRRDIPELLHEADCFVHLPNWEEGFGITIVEAMAAGKVCVCTKRGAIPEIIEDQKNGFLIAADAAPADVALVLENVWRNINSSKMEKLRHMAQERAADFSIERYTAAMDKLIAE